MVPTVAAPPARQPRPERLARVALAGELADDPHDGLRHALRQQLRGLLRELDLHVADTPAELHVIPGRGATVQRAALDAEEADVGDVVLAARVGAAGDVDADPADLGQPRVLQCLADVGRDPRDCVTARLPVSAPGQETTSPRLSRRPLRPCRWRRAWWRSGSAPGCSPRSANLFGVGDARSRRRRGWMLLSRPRACRGGCRRGGPTRMR